MQSPGRLKKSTQLKSILPRRRWINSQVAPPPHAPPLPPVHHGGRGGGIIRTPSTCVFVRGVYLVSVGIFIPLVNSNVII